MRAITLVTMGLLALAPFPAVGQGDVAAPNANPAALPWLSHVVGSCWRAEFFEGTTRDRQCFRLQFDKVVRVEQTINTLKDGRVVSTLTAESLYAWDPNKQSVRHIFWASDGSFESATGLTADDTFVLQLDRETDTQGAAPARTVLRKLGANSYCVTREKRQGDHWVPLFGIVYERDGLSSQSASKPASRAAQSHQNSTRACGA